MLTCQQTSPDIYYMLGKGHFLSTMGQCKV